MARGVVGALIGAGLLALVGLVIGLITGIQIGGNYFSDFEFEPELGHRSAILASVGAVTCGDAVAWCFV